MRLADCNKLSLNSSSNGGRPSGGWLPSAQDHRWRCQCGLQDGSQRGRPRRRLRAPEVRAPSTPSAPWDCPHAMADRSAITPPLSSVRLPCWPPCPLSSDHQHPWVCRKASDLVVGQASRGLTNIRHGARHQLHMCVHADSPGGPAYEAYFAPQVLSPQRTQCSSASGRARPMCRRCCSTCRNGWTSSASWPPSRSVQSLQTPVVLLSRLPVTLAGQANAHHACAGSRRVADGTLVTAHRSSETRR